MFPDPTGPFCGLFAEIRGDSSLCGLSLCKSAENTVKRPEGEGEAQEEGADLLAVSMPGNDAVHHG